MHTQGQGPPPPKHTHTKEEEDQPKPYSEPWCQTKQKETSIETTIWFSLQMSKWAVHSSTEVT